MVHWTNGMDIPFGFEGEWVTMCPKAGMDTPSVLSTYSEKLHRLARVPKTSKTIIYIIL